MYYNEWRNKDIIIINKVSIKKNHAIHCLYFTAFSNIVA